MVADYYLSPNGNDSGSGTLADPWRSLAKARGSPAGSPVYMLGGAYVPTAAIFAQPLTLIAVEPVTIGTAVPQPVWSQVALSAHPVWHATVSMAGAARQATWTDCTGQSHRTPLWAHTAPQFDTAQHWADTVLNPGNSHTRWGLWSTATDLYVIPPVDGSWADPNQARVTVVSDLSAFDVRGPDFSMSGPFTIAGHQHGVRLGGASARCHLDGLTFRNNGVGVGIYGDLPATYSRDHLIEHCRFEDDLTALAEGQTAVPHQMISWNAVKAPLNYGTGTVSRALVSAESVGFRTEGGSINTVAQDCVFDGCFDGATHYMADGRYDAQADSNLRILRCTFKNIADDGLDRSRYQNGVVVEDCTFENVGVVLSPAPLWGTVTLRRCTGWLIGDQVRVADGTGSKPPGSVVKCGAIDAARPQGTARIEDSLFWTDNPTTQGIGQDGGVGGKGPRVEIVNTTMRVGYIAVNWPYAMSTFVNQGNTWATSGTRPVKPDALPIVITPVAEVDARYYDPANGNFEDTAMIAELEAQIAALEADLITTRAALQAKYDGLIALVQAKKVADAAFATAVDALLAA